MGSSKDGNRFLWLRGFLTALNTLYDDGRHPRWPSLSIGTHGDLKSSVRFVVSAYPSFSKMHKYGPKVVPQQGCRHRRYPLPIDINLKMFTRLLLFAAGTFAALYHGEQVCDGPYVLCAAAPCTYLPGNSSFATCTCVGPYTGLNLGTSNDTCQSRTESLISTFSLRNPYAPPSQYETGSGNSVGPGRNGGGGYGGGGWNRGHGGNWGNGGGGENVPPVYAIPCVRSNAAPWTDW